MKQNFLFLLLIISLASCERESLTGTHMGMSPIYVDLDINDRSLIKASDPRAFGDLGGIVERGKYLYLMERHQGIHVVDNTNPSSPQTIKFWNIPGINLFTLDSTRLYADNGRNLWVIDITDINTLKVIDVEENVFENDGNIRPPLSYTGYFECVDLSNGIVVGWEMKTLDNPQCRTFNFF